MVHIGIILDRKGSLEYPQMKEFCRNKGDNMSDWRLTNQSEYLLGKTFCSQIAIASCNSFQNSNKFR